MFDGDWFRDFVMYKSEDFDFDVVSPLPDASGAITARRGWVGAGAGAYAAQRVGREEVGGCSIRMAEVEGCGRTETRSTEILMGI